MAKNNSSSAPLPSEHCPVIACKKPTKRMHFCEEHFAWYKEGLINKRGEKPSDFDKKFQHYMRKKAA